MSQTVAPMLRAARAEDVPLILELIRSLGEFERLADQVRVRADLLEQHLFGDRPYAECVIAWAGDLAAGFALYFHNYSTFAGRPGLYLEDLFVRPEYRGLGYGEALLRHLARTAVERGCARFEWSVLDWNQRAIDFYRKLGAEAMDEWTVFRVSGDALRRLAGAE
jgi:ribosomal protein S18 acetylase RimI-like enzyme